MISKRLFSQGLDYDSGAYFAFANKDRGFLSGAGLEALNGEWQGSSQKGFHLDKFDQLFKITLTLGMKFKTRQSAAAI